MNNNFNTFQTSGYINKRNDKKTLIIDVQDGDDKKELGSGAEFTIDLFEPLIIDKHSELYLDNFITYNSMMADKPERSSMCLKINEFQINTNCASNKGGTDALSSEQTLYNSIVIPNENRDIDNFFTSVSHKAKKYNYICDVNPMTISSISGKITDLNGNPIFHGSANNGAYNTYALLNITSPWEDDTGVTLADNVKTFVPTGTKFELSIGGAGGVNCTTIASFNKDSSALYFVFNSDTGAITTYNNKDNIQITFTDDNLEKATPNAQLDGGGVDMTIITDRPTLIRGGGRMVAELSIVSRE